MRSSESLGSLAEALALAQAAYPKLEKKHTANVGTYKYSYADLADAVETAKKVNVEHGLAVSQMPEWIDSEDVLSTRLMHKSGEWLEGTARLFLAKEEPQTHGSAITYQRRYSYCAILGIVPDEDDDGAASTAAASSRPRTRSNDNPRGAQVGSQERLSADNPPPARQPDTRQVSPAQLNLINVLMKKTGLDIYDLSVRGVITSNVVEPTQLTMTEGRRVIDHLKGVEDGSQPSAGDHSLDLSKETITSRSEADILRDAFEGSEYEDEKF